VAEENAEHLAAYHRRLAAGVRFGAGVCPARIGRSFARENRGADIVSIDLASGDGDVDDWEPEHASSQHRSLASRQSLLRDGRRRACAVLWLAETELPVPQHELDLSIGAAAALGSW
jgi:hypothetical protein